MKMKPILMNTAVAILTIFYLVSCSQQSNESQDHNMHAEHENEEQVVPNEEVAETDGHEHDHGSGETMDNTAAKMWMPIGEDATTSLNTDFHFIVGGLEDLSPEIIKDGDGVNILKLNASANPASFVLHNQFGNVGVAVSLNVKGFQGEFKIVHHAKDVNTYEFVSINGNKMKLGRMVEGKETVLDEGSFEPTNDWFDLRASAAGTHYKGYFGGTTTTHGHAEIMESGYVGIMINGTGEIKIKKIEVTPIEAE